VFDSCLKASSCSVSGSSEEETDGDDGEGKETKRTGELLMTTWNDLMSHVFNYCM